MREKSVVDSTSEERVDGEGGGEIRPLHKQNTHRERRSIERDLLEFAEFQELFSF